MSSRKDVKINRKPKNPDIGAASAAEHSPQLPTSASDYYETLLNSCCRHRAAGEIKEAQVVLQSLLASGRKQPLLDLGRCARQCDDLPQAADWLAAAMAATPHDRTTLLEYATTLRELGRLDDAIAVYRMLLVAAPNWSPAVIGLGLCSRPKRRATPKKPLQPDVATDHTQPIAGAPAALVSTTVVEPVSTAEPVLTVDPEPAEEPATAVGDWAEYEAFLAYRDQNQLTEAAKLVQDFLKRNFDAPSDKPASTDLHAEILALAHKIFDTNTVHAREIYAAAYAAGISDYLSILRVIEGAVDTGRIDQAQALLDVLQSRYELESFGYFAMSRLLERQGRHQDAVKAVVKSGELLPGHAWLRAQVCFRLIELQCFAEADAAIDWFGRDPLLEIEDVSRMLPPLQFRAAVRQRNIGGALDVVRDPDLKRADIDIWIFAEAIYSFASFGGDWTADERAFLTLIRDYLWTLFRVSEPACLAVLHFHMSQMQWDVARDLVQGVADQPVYEARDMVVRRFEIACHLQDLPVAHGIFDHYWLGNPDLNLTELILSMRFLAEMKEWDRAADSALEIIRKGLSSVDDVYGMVQIVRRSNRHEVFMRSLEDAGRYDPFAARLRQLLVDDICVGLGRAGFAAHAAAHVSRENAILIKSFSGHRPEGFVGFLCTDKAYFFSVLTLIGSLAASAGDVATWYLFVAEDVPQTWIAMLQEFCRRLDFPLAVVPEHEFYVENEGCPTDYGLFSGGRNLARSAYFRIYAAKWLLRLGKYTRGVYMDSDIVCQDSLADLFAFDLDGAPLAARPEEFSNNVLQASIKCGVTPERYINSGVLVFDFTHADMENHLHDAIWQSENAGTRLTFHDQCALNIAFAGQIACLPARFNAFLRPFRSYENHEELVAGVLLHYLDRPKPWDSGFVAGHREPWMRAASVVKALAPADLYREIATSGLGIRMASLGAIGKAAMVS